jgi:ABC-type transport system involved in multi-copper enzyme maturation permease subunit
MIFLGLALFSAMLITIGFFISSLTSSKAIAVILTFAVFIAFINLDLVGIWSGNLGVARVIAFISPVRRLARIPNLASIIYFISASTWFLLLTIYIRQLKRRRSL